MTTDPTKPGREDEAAVLAREIAQKVFGYYCNCLSTYTCRVCSAVTEILPRLRAHDSERDRASGSVADALAHDVEAANEEIARLKADHHVEQEPVPPQGLPRLTIGEMEEFMARNRRVSVQSCGVGGGYPIITHPTDETCMHCAVPPPERDTARKEAEKLREERDGLALEFDSVWAALRRLDVAFEQVDALACDYRQAAQDAQARLAEARGLLALAQEHVCSLLCPSVWKTGDHPDGPPHCDPCKNIRAFLAPNPATAQPPESAEQAKPQECRCPGCRALADPEEEAAGYCYSCYASCCCHDSPEPFK